MDDKERGRLAKKAGGWFVISSIMLKLTAVITTPIFTRLLTKAEYGNVATFNSWCALLIGFTMLDLTSSVGRAKLDFPGKLNQYIGSIQLLAAAFTGAVIAIASCLFNQVAAWLELDSFETILLGAYLMFSPAIRFRQLGYRYEYKYKQNIAIAIFSTVASIAISLLLIWLLKGNNEHFRIIGIVAPTVGLSLIFWIGSIRRGEVSFNWTYWKYGLIMGVPLVFHKVAASILTQSDRIFITKYNGSDMTALYSLAYSYSLLISAVTTAISDGWLPWFHDTFFEKKYDDIRKAVRPLVVLGCYIGLASVAFAPEAVLVLGGKDYLDCLGCVPPIVVGVVCQYIYTHYVNIEMHMKKTFFISLGTVIAAVTNLVLNWIFVPKYGFVAAAYTTLASYFVLMVAHCFITRVILKVKVYDEFFMFGAVLVVGVISAVFPWLYDHTAIRYAVIAVGFLTMVYYFRSYIFGGFLKKKRQKKEEKHEDTQDS